MTTKLFHYGTAVLTATLLGAGSGCATFAGSWDYGLPKDEASKEDRLWHIVFPLSVAAAESCVFKREETYGFLLSDELPGESGNMTSPALLRFVHPQLPAGKAGMAIGDAIVTINGDPVNIPGTEPVSSQIQRLTRARIQPLTLRVRRQTSEREVSLWSVPSCRMHVRLITSPKVNALSDGSNIVVTTGLLEFVRSPDQLAWVIAHELGHHVLEHSENKKLQLMLNQFLGSTVGEKPIAIRQIELERQADVFAANLTTRAGYDLREARRLLGWMQVLQKAEENELTQSHPPTQERLEALDTMISEVEKSKTTQHLRVQ